METKKVLHRRRGVALVETPQGVLLVAKKNRFGLPGGGANPKETREQAAIRELYEETGLRGKIIKYLFNYTDPRWHFKEGKTVKNHSKVFLVKAQGTPKPMNEIKYIDYWNPEKKILLKDHAKSILRKYLKTLNKKF